VSPFQAKNQTFKLKGSSSVKDKKKKNKANGKDVPVSVEKAVPAGNTVARVTEITASSSESFDDAISMGIARACKTLQNVTSAWVQDQKVDIENGEIKAYRVNLKVTFVLNE